MTDSYHAVKHQAELPEPKCEIHSIAITETSRSRSPKTIDGDHRKRSIAIGGPTGAEQIPGRSRGDQRVPAGLTPQ
jgi:hypothetical protein